MEPRTLEELYRRYAGELYLYAYSLCQNKAQAQDLTAEAFCRALLALDGADAGWRSWLYKVCRNLWLDQVRRSRRLAPEPPGPELAAEGDVLEELLQEERRRAVYRAVQALSPVDRDISHPPLLWRALPEGGGGGHGTHPRSGPHPAVPGAEEAEEQIGGTDMTFRELLDKYRAGQASEEERALVEAELEKSEAIADYLAEQVEDALGAAETQAPAGEVRHIQKKVNRRLRRTAVWAACIVLAVLLGVRFVVSPLVSSLYYQPNAYTVGGMEDRAPDSLVEENGVEVISIGDLPPEEAERYLRVESQDVAVDLTALYSLIAPGTTVTAASAQPEGFGRYTLTVETEAWLTGETSQRSGELGPHADGFWAHSSPGRSILEIMESAESGRVSDKLEFSRHTPDYLRELPGTSYVAAWVHFPEHLNPVKLYWLEEQQEYSGIRFLWAGVRTGEESMLGFPMLDARGSGFSPDWEDYPMFNWAQASLERAVGVAYEQRFRSLLAYVNDRPQAIEALLGGEVWADYYQSYFAEAAAYVEANGVEVTGALVYAEADDLLRLWENGDVDKIAIDTVLPSKYSAGGTFGWG